MNSPRSAVRFRSSRPTTPNRIMSNTRHLFTSESVSMGHPDKVADAISDAVLDLILDHDSEGRCACETLVTTAQAVVAGEIKFRHNPKKKFDV